MEKVMVPRVIARESKMSVTKHTITKQPQSSEISMQEFLEFLRTAYQVNESVEETLASVEGNTEVVDWIKLKNSELVNRKPSVSCQTVNTIVNDNEESPEISMRVKLDELLNEGLLDSVLPYLVPNNPTKKISNSKLSDKGSCASRSSTSSLGRKKSTDTVSSKLAILVKTDSEVEIHVCDEVKKVKKDFICQQKLLVEKMGYFAEVTAGQKLEDMDISVHCDIQIFEWLMRWVKKDLIPEEDWPALDAQCVIPILVSAAFLQMEPLLQDCLFFCHENMNEILQTPTNLNCINDSIITRLAAMYTNSELETIKDKRDKIQSRLYCKMILSLSEQGCESVRGHWNSLSRIYQCSKCSQLVMPEFASILPCHPSCMSVNRYGDVISQHIRDTTWNLNDYVLSLQIKLKTWRKVYWHLWGDCHYLLCTICDKPFPAHKLKWCCYHPEVPQYFTVDSQKAPLPVGRYPCCGDRAYRFELLTNYSGCRFREHVPNITKARDAAVYAILDQFRDVIDTDPPELIFPERLTRLVARDISAPDGRLACKEIFWWEGLQIVPPRINVGLLGGFSRVTHPPRKESPRREEVTETETEENSSSENTSSSPDHSEESSPPPPKRVLNGRRANRKKFARIWSQNLSARGNQDIQRSSEELVLTKMILFLNKSSNMDAMNSTTTAGTGGGGGKQKCWPRHITPPGGIYTRLEAEWKEINCGKGPARNPYNYRGKNKSTRLV